MSEVNWAALVATKPAPPDTYGEPPDSGPRPPDLALGVAIFVVVLLAATALVEFCK